MAEKAKKMKVGYGSSTNLQDAITNNMINSMDLVILSDTSEMVFVKRDGTPQYIKSRVDCYDTESDAITAINANDETYAGMQVSIKGADGEYKSYIVQNDDTNNTYIVKPAVDVSVADSGIEIVEF